ncbi:hypothetical protein Aph01nite_76060 [Acrocarpospora phusangensis]|uniref:HTH luxR-type domain-containing protein n=1 Tax=Acrocarpospora phusangensis TaxID=1070424 RepID=A0A919UP65_9ACTN|nr:LuxR C-terminal-related transcriptional regulator [Acrocarpospora phusangensis]GIH29296.1 hypothetical protein Aph01nite_76060 [Acrocarpospora phusangensis]
MTREDAVLAEPAVLSIPKLTEPAEYKMTPREMAVLTLLDEGLTAYAISRRLGIKEATVIKHKENIYRKLAVHDRVTALRKARHLGLLPPFTHENDAPRGPSTPVG